MLHVTMSCMAHKFGVRLSTVRMMVVKVCLVIEAELLSKTSAGLGVGPSEEEPALAQHAMCTQQRWGQRCVRRLQDEYWYQGAGVPLRTLLPREPTPLMPTPTLPPLQSCGRSGRWQSYGRRTTLGSRRSCRSFGGPCH